jgi:signal transduction histidine kinase
LCDANRIHQVVANLVGNAAKFTPPGGRVRVEATRVEGDVRVEVSDTGRGVPEQALDRIFDRYGQAEQRSDDGGLGLGLFIARGIVQAHSGRIWAESTVGRGSTFFFTIPASPLRIEGA